ncbi:hypothetical protein DFJ77DRAFT_442253 [Powellomyces hirtus]|nr:hypothetical protein DFJ77DRAFT_442253 [Powellomyces hirtus]
MVNITRLSILATIGSAACTAAQSTSAECSTAAGITSAGLKTCVSATLAAALNVGVVANQAEADAWFVEMAECSCPIVSSPAFETLTKCPTETGQMPTADDLADIATLASACANKDYLRAAGLLDLYLTIGTKRWEPSSKSAPTRSAVAGATPTVAPSTASSTLPPVARPPPSVSAIPAGAPAPSAVTEKSAAMAKVASIGAAVFVAAGTALVHYA